jgi:hypothetical protein
LVTVRCGLTGCRFSSTPEKFEHGSSRSDSAPYAFAAAITKAARTPCTWPTAGPAASRRSTSTVAAASSAGAAPWSTSSSPAWSPMGSPSTRKEESGWHCGVVLLWRGTPPTGHRWPRCRCPWIDRPPARSGDVSLPACCHQRSGRPRCDCPRPPARSRLRVPDRRSWRSGHALRAVPGANRRRGDPRLRPAVPRRPARRARHHPATVDPYDRRPP